MRIAIMNRKIRKERLRKVELAADKADKSRQRIKNMNKAMAKGFRKMIASKMLAKT